MNIIKHDKYIEEHEWGTVRAKIRDLHPRLYAVVESLSPDSSFKLFKIQYPYGALITDKGEFQIPSSRNGITPLTESNLCSKIKDELAYSNTIPFGIVSNNSIESFFISENHVIPASLKKVGSLVSLWKVLDTGQTSFHLNWSISSGARSICMLPNIKDMTGLINLKKRFKSELTIPHSLFDHWKIFRQITHHENFQCEWYSEIIFFGRQWFEQKQDSRWTNFYSLLYEEFWKGSAFRRDQFVFDTTFSLIQEKKNLKPNPYLADTARHLVAIGCGAAPGFSPATNETSAPIKRLQEIFIQIYGLKKYIPVIMHLKNLNLESAHKLYYSFQMPTTNVFSPKSRKMSSLMVDLQEVKYIMDTFLNEISRNESDFQKTPLNELGKKIQYRYYHSTKDSNENILPSYIINKNNSVFLGMSESFEPLEFPEFSSFFKGCIEISNE